MDLDLLPHAIDVVGIAAGEGIHGGTALRIDDENAADRRLAVVRHQGAGGHHIHVMVFRLVEVDAMRAVEFGPGRHPILLVGGVDNEQHGGFPRAQGSQHCGRLF